MNSQLNFWLWVIGGGGGIALVLHFFVVEIWTLPPDDPLLAASTAPLLHGGDLLVVARQPSIERGQLVRCTDPESSGRFVIGRAMARGGEAIELRGELVYVDRRRVPSPHACDRMKVFDPKRNEEVDLDCGVEEYAGREFEILHSTAFPEPGSAGAVEFGRWYLVSDDRHVHLDSRDFGAIDPGTCRHILLRLVGPGGWWDADSRLTFIW
jgi:signal peptidase I